MFTSSFKSITCITNYTFRPHLCQAIENRAELHTLLCLALFKISSSFFSLHFLHIISETISSLCKNPSRLYSACLVPIILPHCGHITFLVTVIIIADYLFLSLLHSHSPFSYEQQEHSPQILLIPHEKHISLELLQLSVSLHLQPPHLFITVVMSLPSPL